eukprot:2790427-Pyramimonas_sp.AAC.1
MDALASLGAGRSSLQDSSVLGGDFNVTPGVLLPPQFVSELRGQLVDPGDFTNFGEGALTKLDYS